MTKEVIFRAIKPRDPEHQEFLRTELFRFLDQSDPDDTIVITFTRFILEDN